MEISLNSMGNQLSLFPILATRVVEEPIPRFLLNHLSHLLINLGLVA